MTPQIHSYVHKEAYQNERGAKEEVWIQLCIDHSTKTFSVTPFGNNLNFRFISGRDPKKWFAIAKAIAHCIGFATATLWPERAYEVDPQIWQIPHHSLFLLSASRKR